MSDPVIDAAPAPVAASVAAPAPAAPVTAAAALIADPAAAPAPTDPAAATPPALPEGAVQMPGKDATPEQWAEFYGKIGRPETPEGYELVVNEGEDAAFLGEVSGVMHQYGLTKEQALGLQKDLGAKAAARMAAVEEARVSQMNAKNTAESEDLKTAWGDQHTANMHHAKQAVTQFVPAEKAGDVIAAMESAIGYRATIEFFHKIGKGLGEHDAAGLGGSANGAGEKSLANRMYPDLP